MEKTADIKKNTQLHTSPAVLLIDNDGYSYYTSYLACGLAKYRKILLYGFSREDYTVTGANQDNRIKFFCIEDKLPKGSSTVIKILRHLLMFPILFQAVTKTEFDVVHFQDRVPMLFLFLPILKLRQKMICCSLHETEIVPSTHGFRGKLESLFLRMVSQPRILTKYADKIIVHGSSIEKLLMTKGIHKDKIYVVPHFDYRYLLCYNKGDNLTTSGVLNIFSDKPYVLFFGDIMARKGINTLIEAARIVKKRIGKEKFRILIAGKAEGTNASYFFDNLTREDYEYIHIINKYITSYEIPDLLTKSAFLVLPYTKAFQSSVSGVVPLAYTFSKPVIVSDVPSLAEYVDHGKTGFIFEVGNSSQLANYIIELLEDNRKCIEMGNNAYQKMLQEMSLERFCQLLNDLYVDTERR